MLVFEWVGPFLDAEEGNKGGTRRSRSLLARNTLAGSEGLSVLLGNGDGFFQSQRMGAGVQPVAIAEADLNGDGLPDLITASTNSNAVLVQLGNGDGSVQAAQSFAVDLSPVSVAADLLS